MESEASFDAPDIKGQEFCDNYYFKWLGLKSCTCTQTHTLSQILMSLPTRGGATNCLDRDT